MLMQLRGFNFCSARGRKGGMAAAGALSNSSRHKDTGISNRFVFPWFLLSLQELGNSPAHLSLDTA
jgi:hypothetical protein